MVVRHLYLICGGRETVNRSSSLRVNIRSLSTMHSMISDREKTGAACVDQRLGASEYFNSRVIFAKIENSSHMPISLQVYIRSLATMHSINSDRKKIGAACVDQRL